MPNIQSAISVISFTNLAAALSRVLLVRVARGEIHITQYVHLLCILHTDIRTDYFGIIMYIRIIPFLVYIGPSGVRVLPVAAVQNGSGHDKGHFCQAQPQLQFKLSLKAELALFSNNPAPAQPQPPPPEKVYFSTFLSEY